MNPARYARVRELFLEAMNLSDDELRPYLDAACGEDAAIRRDVEALLRHERAAGPFLDEPVLRDANAARGAAGAFPGYRVERVLGEGGMGVVYLATRRRDGQAVALKVLPYGVVDRRLARRLEYEAEVLARLDHHGIARVLEVNVTCDDSGRRPFFAMEYVDGSPLDAYAADRDLDAGQALELFAKVCDAIDHAHRHGVVHRDLKPANVLVTGEGVPKILDFGVSRAVEGRPDDTALQTRTGQIVGTLAYMSPERIDGTGDAGDTRSDVYALGVIAYQLIARRLPHDLGSMSITEAARELTERPPAALSRDGRPVDADVETIVLTAMAKSPERRYSSAAELARDVRRFLSGEPIHARPPSPRDVLMQLLRRHRAWVLATAGFLLLLVAASVVVAALYVRSKATERAARERAEEVLRLSLSSTLDELVRRADALWPAVPALAEPMRAWIAEAERLGVTLDEVDGGSGLRAQRARIRERARPPTADEIEAWSHRHPDSSELAALAEEIAWKRAVLNARRGEDAEIELDDVSNILLDAAVLNEMAWPLVDPDRARAGGERRGLALARRAYDAAGADRKALIGDTLAWAWFAAGRDDEALRTMDEAWILATESQRVALRANRERLVQAVARARSQDGMQAAVREIERLAARREELSGRTAERREWRFDDPRDAWWHDQLDALVHAIERFVDPDDGVLAGEASSLRHGLGMRRRLREAETIAARSVSGPENEARWSEAIAAIRVHPRYDGLVLSPQIGLVPIGPDPASTLWEFWHVPTGDRPERDSAGKVVVAEETGIVLVLLPGVVTWTGAQSRSRDLTRYDRFAQRSEHPVRVALDPFFLSKWEMTQGQWRRLTGTNPAVYGPGFDLRAGKGAHDLRHPVEQVTWNECARVLSWAGLRLPREAEWEYGTRGGTETVWWPGDRIEDLQGRVNTSDRTAGDFLPWDVDEELDDGYVVHAPVGTFAPNPFGLHDVIGNVVEWCADGFVDLEIAPYASEQPVYGLAPVPYRAARGGAFAGVAVIGRSAIRLRFSDQTIFNNLGLRPARAFDPAR